jgi:hypothetical protein
MSWDVLGEEASGIGLCCCGDLSHIERSHSIRALILKVYIFLYVTPCRLVNSYRNFEGLTAFTFRISRSVLLLLELEHESSSIFRNVGNFTSRLSVNFPEVLNLDVHSFAEI